MRVAIGALACAGLLTIGMLFTTGAKAPQDRGGSALLTAEVEKADLPIEVELSGSFVADDKDEIRVEPESYRGDLIITELIAEGRAVKEGDLLIEFDRSSLEDSLEDATDELKAKEIELEKAQADLSAWEIDEERAKTRRDVELNKAYKELEKAKADAALLLTDKLKGVEDADRRVKDAEVDFEQLTQLYEERELHTATENILIERQRVQLENTRRAAEKTKKEFEIWEQWEKDLEVLDKELEHGDKEAELSKGEIKAAAERKEKEAEVSKAERALEKATKKVTELEADADSLRVLAERDGIVFYGTIGGDSMSDIVFVGMGSDTDEMKIGGRVRTHQVLMTVASMDHLSVKMKALEGDIQYLKEGLPVTIRPDAFPALAIDGELTKVDQVASRQGFMSDVRQFTVHGKYEKTFPQLRSGMNCRVTVRADSVPDCLQVPVLAVFSEGGEHYCLVAQGSSTTKRKVKIGSTNGTKVEIQEGLRVGESVALYDPAAG